MNRYVTVDDIIELRPCDDYPRERVEKLFAGRERVRLTTILGLNIPVEDRVWAVTGFLSDKVNRCFACQCALQVAHLWDCPDVVRQYLETQDESIRREAWAAAWTAARDAAQAAAQAAGEKQVEILKEMIRGGKNE